MVTKRYLNDEFIALWWSLVPARQRGAPKEIGEILTGLIRNNEEFIQLLKEGKAEEPTKAEREVEKTL